MVIGLFIPLAWHWHWPKLWPMVQGVVESARREGATVYVFGEVAAAQDLESPETRALQPAHQLDGYIFAFPVPAVVRYAQSLHERGVPVMLIGRRGGTTPRVICDNFNAIRFAVTEFARRGHRRIAFVTGAQDNLCAQERMRGYRQGLMDAGLPFAADLVIESDFSETQAHAEVGRRLRAGLKFSALIACNDLTAISAIDEMRGVGLRVPDDVEVTGFDNVPRSHWAVPRLSTFDMQAYQLGYVSAADLLRKLRGESIPDESVIALPYVPRGSTREPRDARPPDKRLSSEWTEGDFFCERQIERLHRDVRSHALLDELARTDLAAPNFLPQLRTLIDRAAELGVSVNSLYGIVGYATNRTTTASIAQVVDVLEAMSAAAVDEQKRELDTGIVFAAATLPLRELSFESVEESVVLDRLRETLRALEIRCAGLYLQPVGSSAPFPAAMGTWWNMGVDGAAQSAPGPLMQELRTQIGPSAAFLILPLLHHGSEFGQLVLDADSRFIIHYPDLMGQLAAALHGARMHSALAKANRELDSARIDAERVSSELEKSYEALRASEYFYHSLVESLPQFIVRKDPAGKFTYVNSTFAQAFNRKIDEIIGRSGAEVYPAELAHKDAADDARVMVSGNPLEFESIVEIGARRRFLHVKKIPIFSDENECLGVQALYWDITLFRETEEQLKQAQRELVETSRLAGIAEMATGVLHNIGNALNSVNTSASLALDRMRNSKIPSVAKIAELLQQNRGRLAEFLVEDPRGAKLVDYLTALSEHLRLEQAEAIREFEAMREKIDHLNQIVAAQQDQANVAGVTELIEAPELVDYAVRLCEAALSRHRIAVVRDFAPVRAIRAQRQRALQILVNLINNAKDALKSQPPGARQIRFAVRALPSDQIEIAVHDNGMGIPAENLTRVFAFGFTTKKGGHGFGLHSSALAAKEMQGSLHAESAGVGQGATFLLRLPSCNDSEHAAAARVAVGANI